MMKRRSLALLLVLAFLSAPLAVQAQQSGRIYRIGVLTMPAGPSPRTQALQKGLADLGYEEGRSIGIEWKWAAGSTERLPRLASELLRANVDVIVASGPQPIAAVKRATSTIPVVMIAAADPVGAGLVSSLARPGGNLTGLSVDASPELFAKQLQLLKEALPHISRFAVLWNSGMPGTQPFADAVSGAGRSLNVSLQWIDIGGRSEFERAFSDMKRGRVGAALVMTDPFIYVHREQIVQLAAKYRIPAMYLFDEIVRAGGFISYGPSLADLYRRAATYVDKILRGAKPADLPIEQPMKFDLVINLRTAKTLGITIPQGLLLRAEQLIE
jgi:putative ABC transport system substrate-binding protein